MKTCARCSSSALRDPKAADRDKALKRMASLGLVNCLRSPHRATFRPLDSTCPSYSPTSPEVIEARQAWARSRGAATTEPRT